MVKSSQKSTNDRSNFSAKVPARIKSLLGCALMLAVMLLTSCEKDDIDPVNTPDNILPDRFRVEIPKSISSAQITKSNQVDTLMGNDVYQHLRHFIAVGEFGAELAENVMLMIAVNNLSRPLELTYISDDDGRAKHLKIIEDVMFENKTWQYRMTVKDVEGESQAGSTDIALQVFWNLNPLDGVAILNPYNIDRNTEEQFANTQFRVDYSEAGEMGYEAHMIVSFTGFPLPSPLTDPYGLSKMKMFVGKNGDMVSLYGNSEHPNARFFTQETGFNWAFVAAAYDSQDIAVAEVGLPPMNLDASDRETLLETFSIQNVFSNQIISVWPGIDDEILNAYLFYTQAPGYFNQHGFVQAGSAPNQDYQPLETEIQTLAPYNPAHILNYSIEFDE